MLKKALLFAFIVFPFLCIQCETKSPTWAQHVFRDGTMGTSYAVKILVDRHMDKHELRQLKTGIDERLESVNQRMSTYIDSSELMQFNLYSKLDWFPVSRELMQVVQQAQMVSRQSNGAFDITIGPLVNLWGFGPEVTAQELPSQTQITKRRQWVGYEKLQVRENPPALKKDHPELYIDLSAIAKGYAVDKVAEYLEKNEIINYLIEVGGEIRARGHNASRQKWRIGVSSPDERGGIQKVINVADVGIATSGDYRNYFEVDGVRYSHTIDPRTGRPITHNLASVTVVHKSCMLADAYATAIDVMGAENGYQMAVDQNLAVYLLIKENSELVDKMTEFFKPFISKTERPS